MGHLFGNETREVKKMKMDGGGGGRFSKPASPFSDEILSDEAPTNVYPLNFEYDGSTDPWDHLCRFECFDMLYRYSDGVKCRLFATTLSKTAQWWFAKLPAKSVRNFDELRSAFMKQFVVMHRIDPVVVIVLRGLKQEEGETLRNFDRFAAAAVKVPLADKDTLMAFLIKGLREQDEKDVLLSYMYKRGADCTLADLVVRIQNLCFLEEDEKTRIRD